MLLKFIISFFAFFQLCFAEVLDIGKAFVLTHSQDEQNLNINFKFGENIYIYNETFEVRLNGERINSMLNLPQPKDYGEYSIILQDFTVALPFSLVGERLKEGAAKLELAYQGCAKDGICYRPQLKIYDIKKEGANFIVTSLDKNGKPEILEFSEEQNIANALDKRSFWLSLATFFGYGLLLSLTPCVFPMIPILSSIIIAKNGVKPSVRRGFALSLVYVFAMSLAYALAGVAASILGQGVQGALQNAWVLGVFSLVFVLLALSMFGFYELRLPAKFENLVAKRSQNGVGLAGVFIMGFASALIVSPCVAAPLAGALLYIAQSKDMLFGGLALFVMGFGMGVPLLIIGASSGKLLPKPGAWMDGVKGFFGFLMLAMAVWMMARVFGGGFELAGYGVLGVFGAVYLGAFEAASGALLKFKKSVAILVFIYSVMLIFGAATGGRDIFAPLSSQNFSRQEGKNELNFKSARNLEELKTLIKSASSPVMVDFYAQWCASCKELEEITFRDTRVIEELKKMTLIRVDVTDNSAENEAMLKEFGLIAPPALLFFKNGSEMRSLRTIGFINADKILEKLSKI